jgi:hypothetical protein
MSDIIKQNDHKAIWRMIGFLNLALLFVITYYLVNMQATGLVVADTAQHIAFMDQYFHDAVYIPHPIWHTSSYYLSGLLHIHYNTSAGLVSAFFITLYAYLIYVIAKSLDGRSDNQASWFLDAVIALTIGPFFWMSFHPYIYMGPGSPSVWHNVTLFAVKPFALLSVYFTIRFFSTERLTYFLLVVLFATASIFAKPNFIIVFLPSLVVYVLLKHYFGKRKLIFLVTVIFLAIAALAFQFTQQYQSGGVSTGGSVIFDFLGVWSKYTPNVAVSILMALGLPMLISIVNYDSVKENEYIKFTWLLVLFSMILFACFAEGGKRYAEGNFSWSWHISLSLIYIFTIIEYFKRFFVMKPIIRYVLLALMLYQLYVGWFFIVGMFKGINYHMAIESFPFF